MSRVDIQRIEYQSTPPQYSVETQAAKVLAENLKQGLIAIAYAITDLADAQRQVAEATRNPEWMKP
ncbi:MAG: hypothetical protein JWR61_5786 [Ferruginibacter sp.]|nr:hypothetical protein [Ferruginibacter sp.]